MPTLTLLCHAEALGPDYAPHDPHWTYFSLNLAAALSDIPTPAQADCLQLWDWQWQDLSVWAGPLDAAGAASGTWQPVLPAAVQPLPWGVPVLPTASAELAAVQAPLRSEFDWLRQTWPGSFVREADSLTQTVRAAAPVPPWFATLAQAWGWPQPLPLLLRLAVFFRVKTSALAGQDGLVTAPVFTGRPFAGPAAPSLFAPASPAYWPYSQGITFADATLNLTVVAAQQPCRVAVPDRSPESPLNLRRLWAEHLELPAAAWHDRLPALLAEALNLPQLLLAGLWTDTTALAPLAGVPQANIRSALLAGLHDRAHVGAYPPPDQPSVAAQVVAALSEQLSETQLTQRIELVETHLLAHAPDLARWEETLRLCLSTNPLLAPQITTLAPDAFAQAAEALVAQLGQQAVLEKLVAQQWKFAFEQPAADPAQQPALDAFWQVAQPAEGLAQQLGEIDLAQHLACGTAGTGWHRLPRPGAGTAGPKAVTTPKELEEFLLAELRAYATARCGDQAPLAYAELAPPLAGLPAPALAALVDQLVATTIPATVARLLATYVQPPAAARSAFAAEPESLVFQVDTVQRDATAASAADANDYVRRTAGTLLLLRERNKPWTCASYVHVPADAAATPLRLPGLPAPLAAFLAFGYSNDLRQSTSVYRNRPLNAPSPQDRLAPKTRPVADAIAWAPLLRYLNPYGNGGAQLVPLGYGRTYEAHVLVASTAGALPVEFVQEVTVDVTDSAGVTGLAAVRVPWRLLDVLPATSFPVPAEARHERELRRRFPLGQLSVGAAGASAQALSVSDVPPRVSPLARQLLPYDEVEPAANRPADTRHNKASLLLLPGPDSQDYWQASFNTRRQYSCTVYRPSVPLEIWERWTAADDRTLDLSPGLPSTQRAAAIAARRKEVTGAWYQLHDVLTATPVGSAGGPATIDDPAVTHLAIHAECLWPAPSHLEKAQVFPSELLAKAEGLGLVQHRGLTLDIKPGPRSQTTITIDVSTAGQVLITVPEGQVWRVALRPAVGDPTSTTEAWATAARARFEPDVLNLTAQVTTSAGQLSAAAGLPLGALATTQSPFDDGLSLLVEVATVAQPPAHQTAGQALYAGLRLLEQDAPADAPAVALSLDPSGAPDWYASLHRAEALVQRWHWNGLPITQAADPAGLTQGEPEEDLGFPFSLVQEFQRARPTQPLEAQNTLDEQLAEHDAVLFATRDSEDYLLTASTVAFVQPPGGQAVAAVEILRQPVGQLPGAQYFRFGVRAYHRYEGVMTKGSTYDSRRPAPTQPGQPALPEQWRRYVRLSRFRQAVPPPVVRALLPLAARGGTLLVVDEGAFQSQLAGLAEIVEAEIVQIAKPDPAPGEPTHLFQFGPDPVFHLPQHGPEYELQAGAARQRLLGPVGYTFDTNSSAPVFTRASYLWLPPPLTRRGQPAVVPVLELAGFFVQVRFRRRIEPLGHVDGETARRLVSPWTDSFWLRVLAPADQVLVLVPGGASSEVLAVADLTYVPAVRAFRRSGQRSNLVPQPTPAPGSELTHVFYLLATRRIADALGRPDEAFDCLVLLEADQATGQLKADQLPSFTPSHQLRLLEVLHDATFEPTKHNTEALFEALMPRATERAKAMVTRVTPPISLDLTS
jgi:hypothetical protein